MTKDSESLGIQLQFRSRCGASTRCPVDSTGAHFLCGVQSEVINVSVGVKEERDPFVICLASPNRVFEVNDDQRPWWLWPGQLIDAINVRIPAEKYTISMKLGLHESQAEPESALVLAAVQQGSGNKMQTHHGM